VNIPAKQAKQGATSSQSWLSCALRDLAAKQTENFDAYGIAVDSAVISMQRAHDALHAALQAEPDPASSIERGRMDDDTSPTIPQGTEPAIQHAISQLSDAHHQLVHLALPALSQCMTAVSDERRLIADHGNMGAAWQLEVTGVKRITKDEWKQGILHRAAKLLAMTIPQGRVSVPFTVQLAGKAVELVAILLPAWEVEDDAAQSARSPMAPVRPASPPRVDLLSLGTGDEFGAVELTVFYARTGDVVCRAQAVDSMDFRVSVASESLSLPEAWERDEYAGLGAWCWWSLVSGLQAGRMESRVSLPASGEDDDSNRVNLVCRLAVDPATLGLFVTVTHEATGTLIGTTNAVTFDELRADQPTGWGLAVGCLDPMD
jgi:hypothetical protein